jgi:hypothetical protein
MPSKGGAARRIARAGAVGCALLLGVAACHRDEASGGAPPGPSAVPSAFTIGVELRGCPGGNEACERDCEAGIADRCRGLGIGLTRGPVAQRDETKATAFYERGCDLGDLPSCVFAGQMHEYHHGVPEDAAAAVGFYGRACDKGWSAGCYNLAIMLEHGRGIPRDAARAAALYEGSCKAGAKPACDRAAALRAEIDGGASGNARGGQD